MWNLKWDTNESTKQKPTHRYRKQTCGCQGEDGGGIDWEFGISRCKLLYIGWINNKVLLYSTGNYIQYPVVNHMYICNKQCVCVCVCVCVYLNHFVVQQKLTQHCKSTILQWKIFLKIRWRLYHQLVWRHFYKVGLVFLVLSSWDKCTTDRN